MFIRKLALGAAISALGIMGVGSGVASASTHISQDPSGATLAANSVITNASSDPAVLTLTGLGAITCNSKTNTYTVSASSSAGSVSGTVQTTSFTSCSDTVPVINFSGCAKASTSVPTVTVTGTSASGGTLTLGNLTVRCAIVGSSQGCYFRAASAVGTVTNTPSAIAFNNVAVTHTAQGATDDLGAVCGTTASFSGTETSITSGGNRVTLRQ